MKSFRNNKIFFYSAGYALTAVLLTLIQPEFKLFFLAWFAYVPFIYVSVKDKGSKIKYLIAFLVSFIYWLGNLYWVQPVTMAGWIAFSLYTAVLWPLIIWVLRLCRNKKIPVFVSFPVLIVAAENLQGLFLHGFFWRFLAHSQFQNLHLIQIADIFGAGGVSFLIALVNGVIAELFLKYSPKNKFDKTDFLKPAAVALILGCVLLYGRFRIEQTEEKVTEGPILASIQTNVPQSVKESSQASEEIVNKLLELTEESFAANPAVVIWPETMVQGILDERILQYLPDWHTYKIFDKMIREKAKNESYLLVGATGATPKFLENDKLIPEKRYNTAFLYTPEGKKSDKQYNKIHLVPFGEKMPFKGTCEPLYKFFMFFSPYDYDYTLDPGTEYTIFDINSDSGDKKEIYRFGVLICYEDTVPKMARKFTWSREKGKKIEWLVNISNDGWFVEFYKDEVKPSYELAQHVSVCVFRAIENRIPVIRSVNTGISCLIDSDGSIRDGYKSGTLPKQAMERKAVSGWFADRLLIDKRITVFSRTGRLFDKFCIVLFFMPIIKVIAVKFTKRKIKEYGAEK